MDQVIERPVDGTSDRSILVDTDRDDRESDPSNEGTNELSIGESMDDGIEYFQTAVRATLLDQSFVIRTYTYTRTHAYTHIHIHMSAYHMHLHMHTHTYTYTYIHIHTHAYTPIYTNTNSHA